MALNTRISNECAKAACDAIVDRVDVGAGTATVKIYPGTQPADPDTATGETELATLNLPNPAFGAAADATPGGRATANPITPQNGTANGTAAWFRVFDRNGLSQWDGECGTSGADMNLVSLSISIGQPVEITSWTVTMPES